MSRLSILSLVVAATFAAHLIVASGLAPNARADSSAADARAKEAECLLIARLPKTTYKSGEKIITEIEYKNQSNRDLTIWSCGFWPNHKVVVKDEAGESPPLTARGKQGRDAFAPAGDRDKNVPIVIASGKTSRGAGVKVDVASLYQLDSGHQYTLEIVYDDRQQPTPLKMTSKAVEFKLK